MRILVWMGNVDLLVEPIVYYRSNMVLFKSTDNIHARQIW